MGIIYSTICDNTPSVEVVYRKGGALTIAYELRLEGKIGVGICGNSGRPGGGIGPRKLNGEVCIAAMSWKKQGQEESIVKNWLNTTAHCENAIESVSHMKSVNNTFRKINGKWGLLHDSGFETVQNVDYCNTCTPQDYCRPAFIVNNAMVSDASANYTKNMFITLVFVAGPNASKKGSPSGSMQRTANKLAQNDYEFFKKCIAVTLGAMIDAMILDAVQFALIGRVSTGIYAGIHEASIEKEWFNILDKVLDAQNKFKKIARRNCFKRIIVPMLLDTM